MLLELHTQEPEMHWQVLAVKTQGQERKKAVEPEPD
jgi:hypothetical protein